MSSEPPPADGSSRVEQPVEAIPIEAAEAPVEAIIVTVAGDGDADSAAPRLPQPNLLVAVLLAVLPIFVQVAVSIVLLVLASIWMAVRRGAIGSPDELAESVNGVLLPLATLTNLIVAVLVVVVSFGRNTARRIAWRNCTALQWMATLLLVLPLAILASEVSNCATEVLSVFEPAWLEDFRKSNGRLFEDFSQESWVLVLLAACLLPGLGEEIYCRGLISRGLIARYGVFAGAFLASLLFGAMHVEPIQACSAFVLGLALQYLFLVTRSLPAAVALHMLNNFLAFVVMRLEARIYIPGLSLPPEDQIAHTPPLLLTTALLSACALCVVLFQARSQWKMPDGQFWSPGYVTAESPPAEVNAVITSGRPHAAVVLGTAIAYAGMLACVYVVAW